MPPAVPPAPGPQTAAAYLVTAIPRAHEDTPISEVMTALIGRHYACADTIFVTDSGGRLQGIVRINDLFTDGGFTIGEIMEPEHEAVTLDADREYIARTAMQLNMIAVPVVDDAGILIGAVPPEALLKILYTEHMEDLQRLAGIVPHDLPAQDGGADLPLLDRVRRRLPWLIVGLFASSIITLIMAGFEATMAEDVAVAFFVPAIVYIAGAIGTQTVTVAVRDLSSDRVSAPRMMIDELKIGAIVGVALGLISSAAVFGFFGHSALSMAVGLSVSLGALLASAVGFGLPWAFRKWGADPAMGSGPICTIIQDAASLVLYFLFASYFVF